MARLRIDLTLTAGEESVWSISTGEAEADDAETLIEKLISMALPEKERMAERAAGCGGRWTVRFAGCVHRGVMPTVYLDRRFISFCAEIHAAILYDIRIAAENAVFGQPECGLGIIPGFGGTQRLARLVGKGRAKELIFTCDRIDAQEAYRIGLANKVVPKEELMAACETMARKILSKGSYAVTLAKACVESGMDTDLENGLRMEATTFGMSFATHDKAEGMRAFLEKRPAQFTD